MYKLLIEIGVLGRINVLPKKDANNIKSRLKSLAENPFPDGDGKKEIKGTKKSIWRLRTGNYRFFYIIDNEAETVKITEFLTAEQAHRAYGRL